MYKHLLLRDQVGRGSLHFESRWEAGGDGRENQPRGGIQGGQGSQVGGRGCEAVALWGAKGSRINELDFKEPEGFFPVAAGKTKQWTE